MNIRFVRPFAVLVVVVMIAVAGQPALGPKDTLLKAIEKTREMWVYAEKNDLPEAIKSGEAAMEHIEAVYSEMDIPDSPYKTSRSYVGDAKAFLRVALNYAKEGNSSDAKSYGLKTEASLQRANDALP